MNNYPWLDQYLQAKAGCVKDFKQEWEWWRYQVGGKLFAATCQPGPGHPAYDCRELLTLKCEPLAGEALREEYADILPGFYMNKTNWISIYLDGQVPEDLLRELCDQSHRLVLATLSKKAQKEILQQEV